jgi:hypothetical protein
VPLDFLLQLSEGHGKTSVTSEEQLSALSFQLSGPERWGRSRMAPKRGIGKSGQRLQPVRRPGHRTDNRGRPRHVRRGSYQQCRMTPSEFSASNPRRIVNFRSRRWRANNLSATQLHLKMHGALWFLVQLRIFEWPRSSRCRISPSEMPGDYGSIQTRMVKGGWAS